MRGQERPNPPPMGSFAALWHVDLTGLRLFHCQVSDALAVAWRTDGYLRLDLDEYVGSNGMGNDRLEVSQHFPLYNIYTPSLQHTHCVYVTYITWRVVCIYIYNRTRLR
jgi:hypothetical protein